MSGSQRNSIFHSGGNHSNSNNNNNNNNQADADNMDLEKIRAMRKNKLFRRLQADIKERDRKRKPGRPEQYVDRDRLIAVTLGESDIRETMLRQRMFLTKNTNMVYEEEQSFKILLQQAEHELHRGAYERALAYLNKAAKMVPDDPVTLLLRSSCLVGVQDYHGALEDIDVVLEAAPCSRALLVKGDALYHLGDFEHALIFYHRALARKTGNKEEEAIRFGIARAETAVDNSVGNRAEEHFIEMTVIIKRIPDSVFGLSWHDLQKLGTTGKVKAKPQPSTTRRRRRSSSNNGYFSVESVEARGSSSSRKEAKYRRDLLGELTKDLAYLETLASDTKLKGGDFVDPKGRRVNQEAEEAITFLRDRQDFWSQFRPMYCDAKKK